MHTAIVGVGNILMKDEGVGVHVAHALRELPLPDDVEVIDGGTSADVGFDVERAERVIVIDAVRGGGRPGTIYRFAADAVPSAAGLRSSHNVGLLQTLRNGLTEQREILIIGIEPKAVDCGLDLSPEVAAHLPRIVEIVRQELRGGRCS
jgi:hydrogenase maturation protease